MSLWLVEFDASRSTMCVDLSAAYVVAPTAEQSIDRARANRKLHPKDSPVVSVRLVATDVVLA